MGSNRMIQEQFIQAKTKQSFETYKEAGNVHNTSLVFIEDSKQLWTNNKYYSTVPEGGEKDLILTYKANGEAKWSNVIEVFPALENLVAYGIEWLEGQEDPHCIRIGNMTYHKTLPILNQLKGCIAQGNKIIYWLGENDWRFRKEPIIKTLNITDNTIIDSVFNTYLYKKAYLKIDDLICQIDSIDLTTTKATIIGANITNGPHKVEFGSVLNGYDGTVRVYCPTFYIKSRTTGGRCLVLITETKIDDTWICQPSVLIDAYRCTLLNTIPKNMGYLSTLPLNSTISVVNEETYCRGGNNSSEYDLYLSVDKFRTLLNKPRTAIPRATMRTYARNSNSELLSYEQYKNIFYWLYIIEYANFNCLDAFTPTLTTEGFKLGGLGMGVTTFNWEFWTKYNSNLPITYNGYCNEFGNSTNIKTLIIPETTSSDGTIIKSTTMQVPRWRGFDNIFGDIWTNLDGILIDTPLDGANDTNILPTCYIITESNNYTDSLINIKTNRIVNLPHNEGYIKSFNIGISSDIVPKNTGGAWNKSKCDHYGVNYNTSLKTLIVGAVASHGAAAGLGAFYSNASVDASWTSNGFRAVSSFVVFRDTSN